MTTLTPGLRVYSAASAAEAIVVTGASVELTCAGTPVLTERPESSPADSGSAELLVGKRYEDAESGLVMMVTRAGSGPLAADGRDLTVREAKALPSSD